MQECLNYLVARPGTRHVVVRLKSDGEVVLQLTIEGDRPLGLRDALSGKLKVMTGDKNSMVEASLPLG